jgi:hypothetical protein
MLSINRRRLTNDRGENVLEKDIFDI